MSRKFYWLSFSYYDLLLKHRCNSSLITEEHPFVWLKENRFSINSNLSLDNWKEIEQYEYDLFNECELGV